MNQATHLHRVIYIGGHCSVGSPALQQLLQEVIAQANSEDPDENLTGFLLCYDRVFVHVLEVSIGRSGAESIAVGAPEQAECRGLVSNNKWAAIYSFSSETASGPSPVELATVIYYLV